ncbi:sugar phosphate isomerase/epimerase [bacterium]|nr:sugar phosphate isomerase/epimerase [bacterium]
MNQYTSRRQFFQTSGAAVLAGCFKPVSAVQAKPQKGSLSLGMASYTFRQFSLEQAVAMTQTVGVNKICLKSMHLPLEASAAEIKRAAESVRRAGLDLYGAGVIYMANEAQVHQAFSYAQTAALKMIVGVPDYELLALCDHKVRETGIILAIHNHGPGDERYPSPADVYERVKKWDKRIGLCMDVGHTMRIAQDPAEAAKKYFDRLYDIHIKDVSAPSKEGRTVEIGRGVINIPRLIKTLNKMNYQGVLALEYEKNENDPLPGAAESIGYVRGVIDAL